MKEVQEGQILPFGLSRRAGRKLPVFLRLPIFAWHRVDVTPAMFERVSGWWMLNFIVRFDVAEIALRWTWCLAKADKNQKVRG